MRNESLIKAAKRLLPPYLYKMLRAIYLRVILGPFFLGFSYKCPICHFPLRRMIPGGLNVSVLDELDVVGAGYRLNFRCPICQSIDRERNIYLFLRNKTNVFSDNLRLLHIAPEIGLYHKFLKAKNIEYITADLNSPLAMIKLDVRDIPFPDDSFDVVICNHVLEHIQEDQLAMSEIFRVIRSAGWALIQVPISLVLEKTLENPDIILPEDRERVFGQKDHVRIYARDYLEKLVKIGFSVHEYHAQDYLCPEEINRFCIIPDESIFLCTVP